MAATYSVPMGQAPVFYYQQDPHAEQRNSQYIPHGYPAHYNGPMAFHPEHMKPFAPHQQYPPAFHYPQAAMPQAMATPVASPQPVSHRPTILIDRQFSPLQPLDTECSPATPALSTSASSIGSPPSRCALLPTPVNGGTPVPDSLIGVKQGCEGEVLTEILAGADLTRSQSPPLTPSTFLLFC